MTRRQFVSAAAASAAVLSGATNAPAATYDLIVKGGRVIDPSRGSTRSATSPSPTAASRRSSLTSGARRPKRSTRRGKIVVPGLIDIHTHAARTKEGPGLCLADGVTGYVDAGS